MAQVSRWAKWALPVAVSGGTMAFLLTRIDFRQMASHVDARVLLVLIPSLLTFGALSLWIEDERMPSMPTGFDEWRSSDEKPRWKSLSAQRSWLLH